MEAQIAYELKIQPTWFAVNCTLQELFLFFQVVQAMNSHLMIYLKESQKKEKENMTKIHCEYCTFLTIYHPTL